MEKFWEKLDQYLFDIVGLFLPGVFALLLIEFLTGFNLEELAKDSNIVFTNSTIIIFCIASFLLGHTVKHCSVNFYKCGTCWLDDCLYKAISYCWGKVAGWMATIQTALLSFVERKNKTIHRLCLWMNTVVVQLLKPFQEFIGDHIFRFKTKPYDQAYYQHIEAYVVKKLSQDDELKSIDSLTDDMMLKNEIYKISDIISRNKGIKSLWNVHLAKYNCYRSLAVVFFAASIFCYRLGWNTSPGEGQRLLYTGSVSLIMFFTFHYKFKRYWSLCSAEALTSLFYYYYGNLQDKAAEEGNS